MKGSVIMCVGWKASYVPWLQTGDLRASHCGELGWGQNRPLGTGPHLSPVCLCFPLGRRFPAQQTMQTGSQDSTASILERQAMMLKMKMKKDAFILWNPIKNDAGEGIFLSIESFSKELKKKKKKSSHCGSAVRNPTSIHEAWVQSLASVTGSRIRL